MRIAVISTFDELCGIAGYTRALVPQLQTFADVEVFDLDQFLLRSPHARIRKLAEEHIKEIASRLGEFDVVNIQLEHGTLGRYPLQIIRRFRKLARASKKLCVTFHTILGSTLMPWKGMGSILMRGKPMDAVRIGFDHLRGNILANGVYSEMRRLQRTRSVSAIVHTKRDARLMVVLNGIKQVHCHPLSYVNPEDAAVIRATVSRANFKLLEGIPADHKLVGTFGFLSFYKGFGTMVRALRLLPEDHHMLVFGGVHPQTIEKHVPIDPYVKEVLDDTRIGFSVLEGLARSKGTPVTASTDANRLFDEVPDSLKGRVHFMGVLTDSEFTSAMAVCDAVALPYIEVGQASSGPLSMAVDMGSRVLASRTGAFLGYSKLNPDVVEFFDIGNHVELAGRIASPPSIRAVPLCNTQTNIETYARALWSPSAQPLPPAEKIRYVSAARIPESAVSVPALSVPSPAIKEIV